ncbi:MAG: UDP-N-acetylmuramate dehydrogenase [Candidatus Omnitrophota bacterium]|jgi:UDP-N-acetylmuramate dehydrogenase
MNLKAVELKHNHNLKDLTTIKIGGQARHFFIVNTIDALRGLVTGLDNPYYVLGGGSNLLVKDSILDREVIKLGGEFDYISKGSRYLEVGSAVKLNSLIKYALKNSLGGLDNLAGIPATVGGLVTMNASSFNREISYFIKGVEVMDTSGNVEQIKKEDIVFSYRQSSLSKYIVLKVWFDFPKDDNLKAKINTFIKQRINAQDFSYPSCGCVFKNPKEYSAGFLIDSCNLKSLRQNGAQISSKHANFIINLGKASYEDVDYLINRAREEVHKKFGIILEEEIKRWA